MSSVAADPADIAAPRPKAAAAPRLAVRSERDLRLDFFRGLALWFIFVDHIPDNVASWFTVRNYGFSDATEIFVFISGYTAVVAYSSMMERNGWPHAAARIVRRCWQLYVAHIMLFVAFTAQIAWVTLATDNKTFVEEMNLAGLLESPIEVIVEAALLKFRPANLDVLPLYIVLLLSFPLVLPVVLRWPWATLAASVAFYALIRVKGWNLPAHPPGKEWYFNPLAWQIVFYLGAALAAAGGIGERLRPVRTPLVAAAVLYLLFSLLVALSWQIAWLGLRMPDWLGRIIYPIDKTNLDVLRLLHFLAIAYLVKRLVPMDAAFLRWRIAEPLRRCGEHSLQIFCLGTFLSSTGYFVLSLVDDSIPAQIGVSVVGIVLMVVFAYAADWYKSGEKAAGAARSRPAAGAGAPGPATAASGGGS